MKLYFINILIAGIILLIALIGAITLTLINKDDSLNKQQIFKQLSRKNFNAVFTIKKFNK